MMILASRSMLYRSRNPMVLFVLTCDLDLSRSLPLQNHILGHISFKKYLEQFERVMYVNALCCPPLCKKMSLTITFELKHLR